MKKKTKINIVVTVIIVAMLIFAIRAILSAMILTNTTEALEKSIKEKTFTLTTQEKQAFNAKFETYESDRQTSGSVESLISTIITSNQNGYVNTQVSVISNGNTYSSETELSQFRSSIGQGNIYTVSMKYNSEGLIDKIEIEKI